eukprot:6481597-Amphidinium_carterae.3
MSSSCDWRKSYACDDGVSREYQWRAECVQGSLRWQARRVYVSAGFEEKSEKTRFHVCWKRECIKLRAMLHSHGVDCSTALGDSQKSMRAKGVSQEAPSGADQAWLATQSLLYQLLVWTQTRRCAEDKRLAQYCLEQFIAFGCGVDKQLITDVPAEVTTLCWCDVDNSSLCMHLRSALCTVRASVAPHLVYCRRLEGLVLHREACASCRQWLYVQLGRTAGIIDESCATWKSGSAVALSPLKGMKGQKRALDKHDRQDIREGRRGSLPANHIHKEMVRHLLHVQAQSRVTFGLQARVIGSCLDSGRVGKPPRDHLMHWLCDLERNIAMIAAPVVETVTPKTHLPHDLIVHK